MKYANRNSAGEFSDYEVWQEFYDARGEAFDAQGATLLAALNSAGRFNPGTNLQHA